MLEFDSTKALNFYQLMEFFPYKREEKVAVKAFIEKLISISTINNSCLPDVIYIAPLSIQFEPVLRGFLKYMNLGRAKFQFFATETVIWF